MIASIALVSFLLFFLIYLNKSLTSSSFFLGVFWLILVWLGSFLSYNLIEFTSSDEIYYSSASLTDNFPNRTFWIAINQVAAQFGGDAIQNMRVINIFFLIFLYVLLVKHCYSISPFLLAILMTYFASIAALNLRDLAIIAITFLCFLTYSWRTSLREFGKTVLSRPIALVVLFLLRPLQALMVVLSTFRFAVIIAIVSLGLVFLATNVGQRYFYNYSYFVQNFEDSVSERAERKGVSVDVLSLENYAFWSARFLLAPPPHSAFQRIFSDDEYIYGKTDLVLRAIHRFLYYIVLLVMLSYLIRHSKLFLKVVRKNGHVVKFVTIYTVVYAIFNFGGSHERIKLMVFVLMIYLLHLLRCEYREFQRSKAIQRGNTRYKSIAVAREPT